MSSPANGGPARGSIQLARAALGDAERVLVRHSGSLFELRELVPEAPDSTLFLLEDWDRWIDRILTAVAGPNDAGSVDESAVRWLPPVDNPPKLICIGANYREHVAEMDVDVTRPRFPYSFMVPPSTGLVGSGATVAMPAIARKIDLEAEVALVIGRTGIAGYSVLNDLSARDWAGPNAPPVGLDWVMSKAYDGFKPMGPYLTPAVFLERPDDLWVRSWVNGEPKQDGSTGQMLFTFHEIVEHLASIMSLEPGDVIATGTPAGVGHGRKPPQYLRAGDRVTVEVAHLGRLETTLV